MSCTRALAADRELASAGQISKMLVLRDAAVAVSIHTVEELLGLAGHPSEKLVLRDAAVCICVHPGEALRSIIDISACGDNLPFGGKLRTVHVGLQACCVALLHLVRCAESVQGSG